MTARTKTVSGNAKPCSSPGEYNTSADLVGEHDPSLELERLWLARALRRRLARRVEQQLQAPDGVQVGRGRALARERRGSRTADQEGEASRRIERGDQFG